ncbi:MAG: hypothetical protein ACI8RZ_001018 [Myxococcota bacterium]|jgi:hypothetical protein
MEITETISEETLFDNPKISGVDHLEDFELDSSSTTSTTVSTGSDSPPGKDPRLPDLMSRLKKVSVPAAFMSSQEEDGKMGSYARAIYDKFDARGFYKKAQAECDSIKAELRSINPLYFATLTAFTSALEQIYTALQEGGSKPEALTNAGGMHRIAFDALSLVPEELLDGGTRAAIVSGLSDIGLFLSAWSHLKETSGSTSASSKMWAAFLQTVERQRQILNYYDLLVDQGGSDQGTREMAMRNEDGTTIQRTDTDKNEKMNQKGGSMGAALESYAFRLRDMEKYKEQVQEIQTRILSGEFETIEEAVEAMLAKVGGGGVSQEFQAELEKLAKGTWTVAEGEKRITDERDKLYETTENLDIASTLENASEQTLKRSATSYDKHLEASEGNIKQRSDEAWDEAITFKKSAEVMIKKAKSYVDQADGNFIEAMTLHNEARAHISNARLYAQDVDTDRFAVLISAVDRVESECDGVEGKLRENEALARKIDEYKKSLRSSIDDNAKKTDKFDPKKQEVDAPSTVIGQLEHYETGKVELSGRMPPPLSFMKLFGGITYGMTWTTDTNGKETTRLENSFYWGFKLDLWLFEIKITMKGASLYVINDGWYNPIEAMEKGNAEKSNYENAREIGAKNYGPDLASKFSNAKSGFKNDVYAPLKKQAPQVASGGPSERAAFNKQCDDSAALARDIQGANFLDGLQGDIIKIFTQIVSVWKALSQSGKLTDGDELSDEILKLKYVEDDKLPGQVDKAEASWQGNHDKASGETQSAFDEINFAKNDPNVEFKSSESIEVGAEVGTDGFSAGIAYGVEQSRSDGKGESFDFSEKTSQYVTGTLEAGAIKMNVKAMWDSEGAGYFTADAFFKCSLPDGSEQTTMLSELQKSMATIKGTFAKGGDWALVKKRANLQALAKEFDFLSKKFSPEIKVGMSDWVTFGLRLDRSKEGVVGGNVYLGMETVLEAGVDAGIVSLKAEHRSGNRVKAVLPDFDKLGDEGIEAVLAKKAEEEKLAKQLEDSSLLEDDGVKKDMPVKERSLGTEKIKEEQDEQD